MMVRICPGLTLFRITVWLFCPEDRSHSSRIPASCSFNACLISFLLSADISWATLTVFFTLVFFFLDFIGAFLLLFLAVSTPLGAFTGLSSSGSSSESALSMMRGGIDSAMNPTLPCCDSIHVPRTTAVCHG